MVYEKRPIDSLDNILFSATMKEIGPIVHEYITDGKDMLEFELSYLLFVAGLLYQAFSNVDQDVLKRNICRAIDSVTVEEIKLN